MGRHRVAHARSRACAGGPRFARRLDATDAPCPLLALHAFRMGVQTRRPPIGVEGPDAHGACAGSQRLASNVARQPRGRVGLGLDVGGGTRAWQRPHPLGPRGRRTVGGGLCSGRLSAGTRVLSLNGMDAAQCAAVARDLGNVEGRSPVGQARTGVHSLTAWVMGQTQSDSLHVKWLDRGTGAVESMAIPGVPLRRANRAWRPISQGGPSVQWTFSDEPNALGLEGASLLSISSFSQGRFGKYQRRLWKGFQHAKELGLPVVIDLRGNAGGQSARMEMLWRHVATSRRQLPFGLVAKQSPETRQDILRHYKRLRKRWVDKHKDSSQDAKYIYDLPTCQWGNSTRLSLGPNLWWTGASGGPVCLVMDGESVRRRCRLRGRFNVNAEAPCLGNRASDPDKAPWATPCSKCCPNPELWSACPRRCTWPKPRRLGQHLPVRPDVFIPQMWRNEDALRANLQTWIDSHISNQ